MNVEPRKNLITPLIKVLGQKSSLPENSNEHSSIFIQKNNHIPDKYIF